MVVFPEGYSPDHEVKPFLTFSYPHNLISLILISTYPYILTRNIKVTRSSTNGSLLAVNVSIIISSFLEVCKMCCVRSLNPLIFHILLEVNEMRQTLRVVLEMVTTWFDPRLIFKHLQKDPSLNVLWKVGCPKNFFFTLAYCC